MHWLASGRAVHRHEGVPESHQTESIIDLRSPKKRTCWSPSYQMQRAPISGSRLSSNSTTQQQADEWNGKEQNLESVASESVARTSREWTKERQYIWMIYGQGPMEDPLLKKRYGHDSLMD
jgi:hypothetical protein